ncbi:MAG: prolyl oligopeptidase family serine peptidase [Ignavibacteria bacterium]|nr:prolyl oligopeptidase family serine peptidase [Ignavibacteria bacterium]
MKRTFLYYVIITTITLAMVNVAWSQSGGPSEEPFSGEPPAPKRIVVVDSARVLSLKSKSFFCMDALIREDFKAAAVYYDPALGVDFSADTLKRFWGLFLRESGEIIKPMEVKNGLHEDSLPSIVTTLLCQKGKWDFKFIFSEANFIERMLIEKTPAPALKSYQFPDYVDGEHVREYNVTVGKGEWALPGSITLPTAPGKYPAVILVHGSGPMDKDETIFSNKPFKDLAWGLASQGVAVLRYDKRTKHYYKKIGAERPILTTQFEVINDALEAIKVLKKNKDIDPTRIFILGHSLGGMLTPRIVKQDTTIAGMIILSGNARPLEDLILEQVEYIYGLDGVKNDERRNIIDQIKRQRNAVKSPTFSIKTPPDSLPLQVPAPYWLDLQSYNPPAYAAKLKKPMLILQGERDYQVTMEDYNLWKKFLPSNDLYQFKSYPTLNHLYVAGKGKSRPDEYKTPSRG